MLNPWHQARRQGLSSSDLAAIVGKSQYRSAMMVQREKLGLEPEPEAAPPSEDAYWGDVMEGPVAQTFAERRGLELMPPRRWAHWLPESDVHELLDGERVRQMVFLRAAPVLRSTPDFLVLVDDAPAIVEVKTTGKLKAWRDGVPTAVLLQTQWHMLCAGAKRAFVVVLFFGGRRSMKFFEITRAPELDGVDSRGARFAVDWWQRHVVERQPCVPTHLDIPWLDATYPKSNGETVVLPRSLDTLDEQFVAARRELDAARVTERRAKAAFKSVVAPLRMAMGSASFAEIEGVPAIYTLTSSHNGRGRTLRRTKR